MANKIIPVPDTIKEISNFRGQGLSRSWRMHPVALIFLICFCIAWDSFLLFWYTMAANTPEMGPSRWLFIIFPIGHVAVGVGLTYWVFCSIFNSTEITVDGTCLVIKHGPLPWKGNKQIPLAEIAQLYVIEAHSTDSYGKVSRQYEVNMVDHNHKQRKLLQNLASAAEALYIEKHLEKLMALKDEPVAGAYEG